MDYRVKTQKEIEMETKELNEQFTAFLKTKGIAAKFKLAAENMRDSAETQKASDKANFEAVKAQSMEDNKEFVEFLQTKGVKAKWNLVVENIKKGAAESKEKTAEQIAKAKAYGTPASQAYTADSLSAEFNAFLKSKGLDGKYTVVITEEA